MRQSVIYHNL